MQIIKYPIKEVYLNTIPDNKMLSLGITQTQKLLCEKSIRQYGLLTPIVLMENPTGELITLTGENELEVLKEMAVDKIEVFVTSLKNRSDSGKMILLLSSFKTGLNPISEGLILRELIKVGAYTQKELAITLMKSKSWVSKRLTLAEQLNEQVSEMVLSKKVCPGSAQEIARLPKEVQFKFATHVYERDMTKASVELLVVTYNNRGTSQSLKNAIIHQPDAILHTLAPQKVIKTVNQDIPDDGFKKFNGSLRLLLSLLSEVEIHLAGMSKEELFQHQRLLPIIQKACSRFQNLMSYHIDSLGKLYDSEITQGDDFIGNN